MVSLEVAKYILIFSLLHASIYLVYSSGFALLFSVAGLPNLAYSIFYTFMAYAFYVALNSMGLGVAGSFTLSILATIGIALIINETAVRPVVRNPLSMFISTIAASYIIEEWLRLRYGKTYLALPRIGGNLRIIGVPVENHWLLAGIMGLLMILILYILINRTRLGIRIRAVAESWEEAYLSGVNPIGILRITSIIAATYAAAASLSLAPLKAISPDMGWAMLFTAFAIIVLAGIGSIRGLLVATLIYAFAEQVVTFTVSQTMARMVPLVLAIVILVIKPTGLFGGEEHG